MEVKNWRPRCSKGNSYWCDMYVNHPGERTEAEIADWTEQLRYKCIAIMHQNNVPANEGLRSIIGGDHFAQIIFKPWQGYVAIAFVPVEGMEDEERAGESIESWYWLFLKGLHDQGESISFYNSPNGTRPYRPKGSP
jgi:hypothetical protein